MKQPTLKENKKNLIRAQAITCVDGQMKQMGQSVVD